MLKLKQKVDFQGKAIYVGLDVHQRQWNVTIYLEKLFVKTFQQAANIDALVQHLNSNYPGATYKVVYETGFCGFWVCRALQKVGIDCIIVHAADVPQTHKDVHTKNDRNDSRRLAHTLCNDLLKGIYIPDPELESDRNLLRYRVRLQRDVTRCKVRVKSLLYLQGISLPVKFDNPRWSKAFINWLKSLEIPYTSTQMTMNYMIEQVGIMRQKHLEVLRSIRVMEKNPRYASNYQLLRKIPGIGPIVGMTLVTEIGNIKRFPNFYHFNSFIGFCPSEHSSGEDQRRGSIIPRHHSPLRELLIQSSWRTIKNDPAMLLKYENWKHKKDSKKAIIKVARSLLNRIYCLWIKNTEYEKGIMN